MLTAQEWPAAVSPTARSIRRRCSARHPGHEPPPRRGVRPPGLCDRDLRRRRPGRGRGNAADPGLTCGIIPENGTHGLRVARRISTGIVHVNDVNDQSVTDEPQAPFGGIKQSGYGRLGGR
ncbi:aldehyde dehydrogenase family protein [Streptomyces sp. NPDC005322]|uniref:aldehyde dehydrogenase family protein n=1 Tax=Streptomyces sp. NPDC005322 TaxID=3157032 RepID=UPI0033AA5667